ncbi:hypothetical protein C496_10466 [Natronorubrum tibetense GA33]|uniref:Uncharacterized protein n=1 Tax=Natronorubrum tibetense GA33 TaxID=1114856 RepID=L9VVA1_9EURY|nr:hypothetical protein C496_10466 [Natronorubrum tibetense GA33]
MAESPNRHINPTIQWHHQRLYADAFLTLGALAAGRILGVDRCIEQHPIVERVPQLRDLLGRS